MECNPEGGLGCQHLLSHHLVALERVWKPLPTWAAHLSKESLEWEEEETSFKIYRARQHSEMPPPAAEAEERGAPVTRFEVLLPGTPAVSLYFRNNIFKDQSHASTISACENKGVFLGPGCGVRSPP